MCGRFTLTAPPEDIAALVGVPEADVRRLLASAPRYNIAPSVRVLGIRQTAERREAVSLQWGLVPHWAEEATGGARTINARAESVEFKPSFRDAFQGQRCLVVADGFYEWKKYPRRRQPYYIRMRDGSTFAFAGLWDRWRGEGSLLESCTIITTEPNRLAVQYHDRMPVILSPRDYGRWLDPAETHLETLKAMLVPYSDEEMIAYPVSPVMNKPEIDGPHCIEPVEDHGNGPQPDHPQVELF